MSTETRPTGERVATYLRIRHRHGPGVDEPEAWWESARVQPRRVAPRAAATDFALITDPGGVVRATVALFGESDGVLVGECAEPIETRDPATARSNNPRFYGVLPCADDRLRRTPTERRGLLRTWASWRRRFEHRQLFGEEPLPFVSEQLRHLPRSRILVIGAGQGRHALWLAALGHEVTAVELVDVAAEQMRAEARSRGLDLEVICADVLRWVQLPSIQRRRWDLALFAYFYAGSGPTQGAVINSVAGLATDIVMQASTLVTSADEISGAWGRGPLDISRGDDTKLYVSSIH